MWRLNNTRVSSYCRHRLIISGASFYLDEQYVAGDGNTSAIGETTVDDDDDDIPHAIAVLLTDNKNDEDEFKENEDDDGQHAAAVLLTDNTDDEDEFGESSVFSATNTRRIVWLMADPTAMQRQIAPQRRTREMGNRQEETP